MGKNNTIIDNPIQGQANRASLRDEYTTQIVEEYVAHQKRINLAQLIFKCIFFFIVCVAFGGVIFGCIKVLLTIAKKTGITVADIGVAITSVVSLVSAVIVLPTKIAEHLFPATGEKDITEFIIKMHEVDTQILSDIIPIESKSKIEERDDLAFLNEDVSIPPQRRKRYIPRKKQK